MSTPVKTRCWFQRSFSTQGEARAYAASFLPMPNVFTRIQPGRERNPDVRREHARRGMSDRVWRLYRCYGGK